MKKVFFGLAFLGSVLMFNQGAKADESLEGNKCYQRMVKCNGHLTAYHCDDQHTGTNCSRFEIGCKNC